MSTILDMNHVYKDFYSLDEERQILKDINFSVEEGEILVLLGPSGCGKSTILNIISGLLEPTQGSVDTHGKKNRIYVSKGSFIRMADYHEKHHIRT